MMFPHLNLIFQSFDLFFSFPPEVFRGNFINYDNFKTTINMFFTKRLVIELYIQPKDHSMLHMNDKSRIPLVCTNISYCICISYGTEFIGFFRSWIRRNLYSEFKIDCPNHYYNIRTIYLGGKNDIYIQYIFWHFFFTSEIE